MFQAANAFSIPPEPLPSGMLEALTAFSRRAEIENMIESLIAMLDALDGDPDMEEDNEDCCGAAHDDDPAWRHVGALALPGDEDDAEDEEWEGVL